ANLEVLQRELNDQTQVGGAPARPSARSAARTGGNNARRPYEMNLPRRSCSAVNARRDLTHRLSPRLAQTTILEIRARCPTIAAHNAPGRTSRTWARQVGRPLSARRRGRHLAGSRDGSLRKQ